MVLIDWALVPAPIPIEINPTFMIEASRRAFEVTDAFGARRPKHGALARPKNSLSAGPMQPIRPAPQDPKPLDESWTTMDNAVSDLIWKAGFSYWFGVLNFGRHRTTRVIRTIRRWGMRA